MSVGQNIPRRDGVDKLTGSARYIDDISFDGMLYGRTIRSTIPRGRIKSIKFDASVDWSQVVIADYRDIPGPNIVALIEDDQPLLAQSEIRHAEEPIILIATEDKRVLDRLAGRIHIEYEALDPVLTIEAALRRDQVIFGADNVMKRFVIGRGDLDEAFAGADLIVEGEYRVPHQEQLYIEPQGMIAVPGPNQMTVLGSMQCPYYIHRAIKLLFNLTDEQAVVIQTTTGGGFGGKEEYP